MTHSVHERIAELHNQAGHHHFAAAVAHRKKDYEKAAELSEKAHGYSAEAQRASVLLVENGGKSSRRSEESA